jgi:hypothetical protein
MQIYKVLPWPNSILQNASGNWEFGNGRIIIVGNFRFQKAPSQIPLPYLFSQF